MRCFDRVVERDIRRRPNNGGLMLLSRVTIGPSLRSGRGQPRGAAAGGPADQPDAQLSKKEKKCC